MADHIFIFIIDCISFFFDGKITLKCGKMFLTNMSLCVKSRFLVCKIMILYNVLAVFIEIS